MESEKLQSLIDQPELNHLLRIMLYVLQEDRRSVNLYLDNILREVKELQSACELVTEECRRAQGLLPSQ